MLFRSENINKISYSKHEKKNMYNLEMNIKISNQILDTKILTKLLETFIYIVNSTIMWMHMRVHTLESQLDKE